MDKAGRFILFMFIFVALFGIEDIIFKGIPSQPIEEHNTLAYFSDGILIITLGFCVWLGCKPIVHSTPSPKEL